MTAACKNTHLFEFLFFCHIKIAMYAETIYLFVQFLCIFFLPVLFDLQVHSELQSSKDQVCPHIKQVFLGVENIKCMVNHRKAVMRTLLNYTITWVVCDLRSWCLTAGVLFVRYDVVWGDTEIPGWGEVSILISVQAGTCSEMMAFRSCSSTCFQGRSIESVSDVGRTGKTRTPGLLKCYMKSR